MSLIRPNALITIDGQRLSAAEAALVWLTVDLTVNGAHDTVRIKLWPKSKFADVESGARISVALGDTDSEEDVLNGQITALLRTPDGPVLEGNSASVALSRIFKSQTYVSQSVADIVSDLASHIAIDKVDADIQLAVYHVDNTRSVWRHLQTLARLSGADLGCSADGGLRFVPAAGALAPTRLRYGAELIDWRIFSTAMPAANAIAAHGAGSEAGAAKWHWLRHDPVGAGAKPTSIVGGIATKDAADLASQALAARVERVAVGGTLLIVGNASIRPGDALQLVDLPDGDPGSLRVVGVQHRLSSTNGYVTRLQVEGSGDGAGVSL
jgi:hypothetical protein